MPSRPCLALLPALPLLLAAPAPAGVRPVSNWAADPSFRLLNRDTAAVQAVHVSPGGRGGLEVERLGTRPLQPGQARRIAVPAGQCVNDIRLVLADGRVAEWRGVNTCVAPRLAVP